MYVVLLLLAVAVVFFFVVSRREGNRATPSVLHELDPRRAESALESSADDPADAIVVWAVAYVDNNVQLDIRHIANFMARKWKLDLAGAKSQTVHQGWIFQLHYEIMSPDSPWRR